VVESLRKVRNVWEVQGISSNQIQGKR